jgi:tRNA dimethylallyltransferase
MTAGNVRSSLSFDNGLQFVTEHARKRPATFAPLFAGCWCVTGPTASGKSAVGIDLARRIKAEIISLDSMAVYRGMNIGTAKPSPTDRAAVPHHLIDVVDPWEDFSVAEYLRLADEAIQQIRARGREPLFVGGTPLYLKALLRGMFSGPKADWDLRSQLDEVARREGSGELHRRLTAVDPVVAAKLHPNDERRLIRALEVYYHMGRPISEQQQQFNKPPTADLHPVWVLDWPRERLHERIDRRVDAMFAAGLVDEVRTLLAGVQPLSRTAQHALGYREVIEHLHGKHDLSTTIDLVKLHTRQFAKRQLTWFRSLAECRWIQVADPLNPSEIAERIALAESS